MPTKTVYTSTRGEQRFAFADALRAGLAPDGGLFVPTAVPPLPDDWRDAESFEDLGSLVLANWLSHDFEDVALQAAARGALNFPVPVRKISGSGWHDTYVVELFHGPTLSFKDFGARTMARLMPLASPDPVTILVATSGDTGSAVADGFSGIPGIRVVLLYPNGQVSPTQERQLIVEREGVTTLRVDGTFDDCQRIVKAAFADPELRDTSLSSANSINIGRLLPQSVYYLWAGLQIGEPLTVCVPSGNLGNMTGAVLAWKSGLDISRFIAAHNANRAFPAFLEGQSASFGPSVRTVSNAMDVGAPSNFERLQWMLGDVALRERVWGTSVSDEQTLRAMSDIADQTGYVADPHTAVGLEASRRYRHSTGDDSPIAVFSTADPAKFPEVMERAIGRSPDTPDRLARLWDLPTSFESVPAEMAALRRAIHG